MKSPTHFVDLSEDDDTDPMFDIWAWDLPGNHQSRRPKPRKRKETFRA